jgi:hypothetical protein
MGCDGQIHETHTLRQQFACVSGKDQTLHHTRIGTGHLAMKENDKLSMKPFLRVSTYIQLLIATCPAASNLYIPGSNGRNATFPSSAALAYRCMCGGAGKGVS